MAPDLASHGSFLGYFSKEFVFRFIYEEDQDVKVVEKISLDRQYSYSGSDCGAGVPSQATADVNGRLMP